MTYICVNSLNGVENISTKLSRHEARMAEADPDRIGRGEQGEARPENSAPRGGAQLELSRRRLKTWSKSDPSASLVRANIFIYVLIIP